ncbi:MAG: molybdopterin-dependent oxidoreductase [Phycisphaerae bacterium]|nr:MAG: ferredoxin [Planctomycetota bacterium]MBE7458459.1 molybdopterin-dependent oxidoreductase [Planctomycetia bacterium]MCK6464909.1 molybdopterin-dependent oxidoreductase [Phycisphaerae bacterium]MCL4719202.1 molybdopterin-dependent oxidoreductase [Phycisphaerae bacterium]MCQ3921436.1 ferredoxin [Planctomycetota bacterium]
MPKLIIDNQEVQSRDGIPVLQAALEAGWDVPHYCYHPGLSIVASCRLCLMEMKMPNPKTGELSWAPKLVPSCQTPVKEGMEVRFDSPAVRDNQKDCMEYFLLNHPLDCPVCDQAGECYLQDYSYKFGSATSRMIDPKLKNPKKDIGPKTLLYQDRCVMCTRCVRFTHEVSGTHELCVINRGSRAEIDVFPGFPLDNPLQGNVVDVCPVGSLLDKDFLFKRRVWELRSADSICPGCAAGCAIRIDHADETVVRLKPRFNPEVNDWWMCDEGRFGWKYVHDPKRITAPMVRRGMDALRPEWSELPRMVRFRFEEHMQEEGGEGRRVGAVLSPFMSCEEAWLLAKFVREVDPQAVLAAGPTPYEGEDQKFPSGVNGDPSKVKFTILKEKAPNRRGVEMVLAAAGGEVVDFAAFAARAMKGEFSAGWIVGGHPKGWVDANTAKIGAHFRLLVVADIFPNPLIEAAAIVLPACGWAEREGSFVNADGLVQPFSRAIQPPEGARRDEQFLFELAGYVGLASGERIRELMAERIPAFVNVYVPPVVPEHAH